MPHENYPNIVYSLGEYAALVTAGVLSLDDGLKTVAGRANLMAEKCILGETGMLAVKMSPVELESYLRRSVNYSQLSVACHNRYVAGLLSIASNTEIALAAKTVWSLGSFLRSMHYRLS